MEKIFVLQPMSLKQVFQYILACINVQISGCAVRVAGGFPDQPVCKKVHVPFPGRHAVNRQERIGRVRCHVAVSDSAHVASRPFLHIRLAVHLLLCSPSGARALPFSLQMNQKKAGA